MTELARIGKKQTILISISILLISLYSTFINQSAQPEIEIKKLIPQIIRFFLTVGLLYLIYIGKNWAKILTIILFGIAIVGGVLSLFVINSNFINKIPFLVMLIVYTISIYHFAISKNFKAFFDYQNNKTVS